MAFLVDFSAGSRSLGNLVLRPNYIGSTIGDTATKGGLGGTISDPNSIVDNTVE